MRTCLALAVTVFALCLATVGATQTPADRERARIQYLLGWENMKAEAWAKAAASFQQAIDIDPSFETAYYGLGRADMALKKYVDAIAAYAKCRDVYQAQAGRQFSNAQDAQRVRNDRVTEIDEMIRQVQQGPQNFQTQEQMRQLQDRRRQMQDNIQRGTNVTIDTSVPPWVSFALGSAYFRAERFSDAEREYKATITADSRAGEAHQNLAVVYLTTGRVDDAERSLAQAKKVGFKVNPQLEQEIKNKKRGS